ncbi:putative exported domain protein, partial [Bacteroides fragilis str. S6L3]
MKARHFFYPFLSLFSVAMSASSCSLFIPQERDIKEGSAFYAVDLLEIEKLKGEEMLFSDLIESLEIIKLDGREEALVATYPSGIDVSSNYILIEPDGVSALK